jgi:AcrR family transcriptional regulator
MGRPKKFNRQGVLEKALPVFWRCGLADASLHELEIATGVNKSGLYSEFKDKEDLFISMEHNLGSSGPSIVCKIDDLMNIVRTL